MVYDLCVYFMTGTPESSPKVVLANPGFLEREFVGVRFADLISFF